MRDYFLFLSDMINAISMPNETISIRTLIISIGATSLLGNSEEGFQCATPHVKPVY
jgi:hypothetical protein